MNDKLDRYQYQKWYVKLWRRRHYIPAYFYTVKTYFNKAARESWYDDEWHEFSRRDWLHVCRSINIGLAQGKMKWYYDWDEVKARITERLDNGEA